MHPVRRPRVKGLRQHGRELMHADLHIGVVLTVSGPPSAPLCVDRGEEHVPGGSLRDASIERQDMDRTNWRELAIFDLSQVRNARFSGFCATALGNSR